MNTLISTFKNEESPLSHDLSLIKSALLYSDEVNLYSHHYSWHKAFLELQNKDASIEEMMHASFIWSDIHDQEIRSPFVNYNFLFYNFYREALECIENTKNITKNELGILREMLRKLMSENLIRVYDTTNDNKIAFNININDGVEIGPLHYKGDVLFASKSNKTIIDKTMFPEGKFSGVLEIGKDLLHNLNEIHKAVKLGLVKDLYGFQCPYIGPTSIRNATFEILSNNEMLGVLDKEIVDFKQKKDKNIEHDIKIASIANKIFSKLPNFDNASIDEIADIRKEIFKYTTGFKKELTILADQVNSSVWDKYFQKDVENQLIKRVYPKIEEIEHAVKENKSLLEYIPKAIDSLKSPNVLAPTSIVGLALVNLGVPLYDETAICSCGIAAFLATLTDMASKKKKEERKIKQNDLYLVYRTKKKLSKYTRNAST